MIPTMTNCDLAIAALASADQARFGDIANELGNLMEQLRARWDGESACS